MQNQILLTDLLQNKKIMNPDSRQEPLYEGNDSKEVQGYYMDEKSFFEHQCPKKFRDASLKNGTKIPVHLINFGREWAKNPVSILITGESGRGKTYYAFALIREMFRRCPRIIWPRYFTSPDLDTCLLEETMSSRGAREYIDNRKKEDLLFIDDLGRENRSERLKRQYFEILNYRYAEELPTILTSNYRIDQIGDLLDGSISSRLQEWINVEFNGPDWRR